MLTEENTKRGRLLQKYVTARVVRLDGINIGLYDYDRYNTLYFFILNADEHIYMRYGGRDERSALTYLNLESLELALEQGLELHEQYKAGQVPRREPPVARYPRQIPELAKRTINAGRCVECHLVGDLENVQREIDGTLDKLRHIYRSPDIRTIGIELDVPKGLRVRKATGSVAEAGMKDGDTIRAFNGTVVWTFGDLQWEYSRIPHHSQQIELTLDRDGQAHRIQVGLPPFWWYSDLTYRNLSVDPRVYFASKPLTVAEKAAFGFDTNGFASRVTYLDPLAEIFGSHQLQMGDIIYGVDGVGTDDVADTAHLYIKLRKQAGSTVALQVLRGEDRMDLALKTERMSFRK